MAQWLKEKKKKSLSANAGAQVQSLGQEDPLEKLATHSSIPAWEIPLAEKPNGLQYRGLKRIQLNLEFKQQLYYPAGRRKSSLPPPTHIHTL